MKRAPVILSTAVVMFAFAVLAAEDAPPTEGEKTANDQAVTKACEKSCNSADAKCSSDVRRARATCSKNASTAGRDPFSQYRPNDYGYFCSYFNNPRRCSEGFYQTSCQVRFEQHYYACMDAMHNNIAAMRYDCFKSERDATDLCRKELRECKAACCS